MIDNWEAQDEPEHLRTIRNRLLKDEQRAGRLLSLCQTILQADAQSDLPTGIGIDNSPEHMELRLSGYVQQVQGRLQIRNNIYRAVFDLNWVEQELAKLRPYTEAFQAWLALPGARSIATTSRPSAPGGSDLGCHQKFERSRIINSSAPVSMRRSRKFS